MAINPLVYTNVLFLINKQHNLLSFEYGSSSKMFLNDQFWFLAQIFHFERFLSTIMHQISSIVINFNNFAFFLLMLLVILKINAQSGDSDKGILT